MKNFKINKNSVGENFPIYFIADIAANHDGDLERALKLIDLAKESGADAAKFQHHDVTKYVSDYGFKNLGQKKVIKKNGREVFLKFIKMLKFLDLGRKSLKNIVINLTLLFLQHLMI